MRVPRPSHTSPPGFVAAQQLAFAVLLAPPRSNFVLLGRSTGGEFYGRARGTAWGNTRRRID